MLFILVGCNHVVPQEILPQIAAESFSSSLPAGSEKSAPKWWTSFNDPRLNDLIAEAFGSNFSLRQSYARIRQARAIQSQNEVLSYPTLAGSGGASSRWQKVGANEDSFSAELKIAWEVDLWRKMSADARAASLGAAATQEDLEATALMLSARLAEAYFGFIEQQHQLGLLEKQLALNETYLDLVKLRFANGASSVVDIYQQRQQLAATRVQIPVVAEQLRILANELDVLSGKMVSDVPLVTAPELPGLPPMPKPGVPADLLLNRPDLRMRHNNLRAADYRVAAAVAARLPQLTISASGGIAGRTLASDNFFLRLAGDVLAPIVDWQSRKNEVTRRQAHVEELLAGYSQAYLEAIREVENALWREKYGHELALALQQQLILATDSLAETRNRYMQGLTDYLPVLTALQTRQRLEREVLHQTRQLLANRILLHRALGGTGLMDLNRQRDAHNPPPWQQDQ